MGDIFRRFWPGAADDVLPPGAGPEGVFRARTGWAARPNQRTRHLNPFSLLIKGIQRLRINSFISYSYKASRIAEKSRRILNVMKPLETVAESDPDVADRVFSAARVDIGVPVNTGGRTR